MAKKNKETQKISEKSEKQDELKKQNEPVSGSFKNILIPFLFILVYTLFTHFYDLGSRAFHHDEGIHAYYSWEIATKGPACYKYDPTYHGTFLYFANAVIYRIWGGFLHAVATDVNARVVPALFGLILIFLFFALKKFIDPGSVIFIVLLGAISPTLTYFSRFIRHDIYITVTTLGMIICFLYYWREKKSDYLSYCFALCALSFVTKEDTYIILFIFFSFIFFKCMVEKATKTVLQEQDIMSYLGKSFSDVVMKKKSYKLAVSILFLRIITLNGLEYYIQNKKEGFNPADSLNRFLRDIRGFFIIKDETIDKLREANIENLKDFNKKLNSLEPLKNRTFSQFDMTTELAKLSFHGEEIKMILHHSYVNRDFMPLLNGLFSFGVIFSVFFTSFFTNPKGLFTGIFGFFSYWVFNQQVKPRIPGPFYYYISKLCLYEFATVLFALIGIWYLLRKKDRLTPVIFYTSLVLIYLYAFAQDTVPMLSQKFILYPACTAGFFYVLWGILRMIFYMEEGDGTFVSFVIYWSLSSLFIYSYAQEKVPWLMVPIVLPLTVMAGMSIGKILREGKTYVKYGTGIILVILLWFNLYTSFRLNFKMGDNPVEPMVFTQTTRDVVNTSERLSDIVKNIKKEEKERGEKKNYVIFVDNEVSWPFVWYFRDFTVQYSLPTSAEDAQRGIAILSSLEKQSSVEPFLAGNFSREHMKLRAWWIADNNKLLSYLWKKELFEINDKTMDVLKNNISEDKLNLIKPFIFHIFTGDELVETLKNMN
ncbi:MAG: flippase activity-associated protein Agl23, partial [Candidatus Eremiobacterota bacterium]